jgi:hypothetical protein
LRKAHRLPKTAGNINCAAQPELLHLSKIGLRIALTASRMGLDGETERYWPESRAGTGHYLSSRRLIRLWFHLMPVHQLDTCLIGLRQQGISVSQGMENGSTFEVMGFTLTAEQIVELHQNGQMDANGIKAFAESIKQNF